MKKILVFLSLNLCCFNVLCQSLKSRDKSNDNFTSTVIKKETKKREDKTDENIKSESIDGTSEQSVAISSVRQHKRRKTKVIPEITVYISTNVPESDVYIDGEKAGKGSFNIKIKEGTHKVEANASDYESASQIINVDKNHSTFDLTLIEKEQYRTIKFSDGIYEGNTIGGKPTKMGKMAWKDGTTYVGEWKDGMRDGNGVVSWSNGDQYFGTFRKNDYYGNGVLCLSNGVRETGYFDEEGFWIISKRELETINYENGDSYQGYLYKGSPNGKGIYFFASGDRFEGYWCGTLAKGSYFVKGKIKPKKGFLLNNKVFAKKSRKKEKEWWGMSIPDTGHVQFKQRTVSAKVTSVE